MPNRYIKESCTTSLTLTALSDAGERLFWRLTTVADDYGRFDANPSVLFGRCVPTLNWSLHKVEKSFTELCTVADGEQEPLVKIYRVRGRLYGCLTNWATHQRDRSKEQNPPKPKFPCPNEGLEVPPQHATNCGELRQLAALNESESEDDNEYDNDKRPTPQIAAMVDAPVVHSLNHDFEEWWVAMPARGSKKLYKSKARELYARYVKTEERPDALRAAKAYATYCRNDERTPLDPMRFLFGQKGEVWREFIPVAAPPRVAAIPSTKNPIGPFVPPPAELMDRLNRLTGKGMPA